MRRLRTVGYVVVATSYAFILATGAAWQVLDWLE